VTAVYYRFKKFLICLICLFSSTEYLSSRDNDANFCAAFTQAVQNGTKQAIASAKRAIMVEWNVNKNNCWRRFSAFNYVTKDDAHTIIKAMVKCVKNEKFDFKTAEQVRKAAQVFREIYCYVMFRLYEAQSCWGHLSGPLLADIMDDEEFNNALPSAETKTPFDAALNVSFWQTVWDRAPIQTLTFNHNGYPAWISINGSMSRSTIPFN